MKITSRQLDFKNILVYFANHNKKNNKDIIAEVEEFIKEYKEEENL